MERKHPDIFNAEEALEYLHIPKDEVSVLKTLREKKLISGQYIGKDLVYHRIELDAVIAEKFKALLALSQPKQQGAKKQEKGPHLRLTGTGDLKL